MELIPANVDGVAGLRMMVILRAPGCVYARKTGGCTNCGFWHHLTTGGEPVAVDDYVAQLRAALDEHHDALPRVLEVDLYCSGSLLADEEVPARARVGLLALCAGLPALRRVVVESRPEYITRESVAPLSAALAPSAATLEVAVGLETVDDDLRCRSIRSLRSNHRRAPFYS